MLKKDQFSGRFEMEPFAQAIAAAQKELDEVNEKISALTQRQAQLRQSIFALKTLIGQEPDEDTSLTEKVRLVIRAAKEPPTAAEVLEGVQSMGVDKSRAASVATILNRMNAEKEVCRTPRKDGGFGYAWTPFSRRPTRESATQN